MSTDQSEFAGEAFEKDLQGIKHKLEDARSLFQDDPNIVRGLDGAITGIANVLEGLEVRSQYTSRAFNEHLKNKRP